MEKILLFNNKWKITIQTLKKQKMIFIRANLWIREDLAYKNWKKMTSTYQILLLISSVMKITVRKNFDFFCPEFNFIGLSFLELTINAYFIDKEKGDEQREIFLYIDIYFIDISTNSHNIKSLCNRDFPFQTVINI